MEENKNAEYEIYKELRRKILLGEIKEGERLVETTLAADFHASRLHIKSALRLLEQENLAQHIPQCGFVAKGVTEEAIEENERLLQELEAKLADPATYADAEAARELGERYRAEQARSEALYEALEAAEAEASEAAE